MGQSAARSNGLSLVCGWASYVPGLIRQLGDEEWVGAGVGWHAITPRALRAVAYANNDEVGRIATMTCFSAGSYSGVEPPACPRNKRLRGSAGAPFGETHCTLAG